MKAFFNPQKSTVDACILHQETTLQRYKQVEQAGLRPPCRWNSITDTRIDRWVPAEPLQQWKPNKQNHMWLIQEFALSNPPVMLPKSNTPSGRQRAGWESSVLGPTKPGRPGQKFRKTGQHSWHVAPPLLTSSVIKHLHHHHHHQHLPTQLEPMEASPVVRGPIACILSEWGNSFIKGLIWRQGGVPGHLKLRWNCACSHGSV